jgi:hypothetical protein
MVEHAQHLKFGLGITASENVDISRLFSNVGDYQETIQTYQSDRSFNFTSRELRGFSRNGIMLIQGRLPFLKFQSVHVTTKVQQSIEKFLTGTKFLALLLGPTGCGKTHYLLRLAQSEFTIWIDAQEFIGEGGVFDESLLALKIAFDQIAGNWKTPNENLFLLREVALAFMVSRMLFLKHLKRIIPGLTPTQFLMHQIFDSKSINTCFNILVTLGMQDLLEIVEKLVDFKCNICVDEAHVLVDHYGSKIITETDGCHVQANSSVNDEAKRGTLSVILWAIRTAKISKKVIFAGTSEKLRNIENFGTFETKATGPLTINGFEAWNSATAVLYVSSLINVSGELLQMILVDYYRPRVLENFVYDLFSIASNDQDSPTTIMLPRILNEPNLLSLEDILLESYNAVIHRFVRVTVVPRADLIRKYDNEEMLVRLLLSSIITTESQQLCCPLSPKQLHFFEETIGSIFLVAGTTAATGTLGFFLLEGYVIDSFIDVFSDEILKYQLKAPLDLLRSIIQQEGAKTSAKGAPFEAVVQAELLKLGGKSLGYFIDLFGIKVTAAHVLH